MGEPFDPFDPDDLHARMAVLEEALIELAGECFDLCLVDRMQSTSVYTKVMSAPSIAVSRARPETGDTDPVWPKISCSSSLSQCSCRLLLAIADEQPLSS